MTKIKLVKVEESQKEAFSSGVFGGSVYFDNFPKILTSGIALFKRNGFWYIYLEEKQMFSHDHFFSEEELSYMTILKESESKCELVDENFIFGL